MRFYLRVEQAILGRLQGFWASPTLSLLSSVQMKNSFVTRLQLSYLFTQSIYLFSEHLHVLLLWVFLISNCLDLDLRRQGL